MPISPAFSPFASIIFFKIVEVEVFPAVPVIPTTVSSFAGYLKYADEISAIASLEDLTFIIVTSSSGRTMSFSTTNTFAPFFITSGIYLCESDVEPTFAIYMSFGSTFLESSLMSEISTSRLPFTSS